MTAKTTHVWIRRHRLLVSACVGTLALLTTIGCWKEVRYEPTQESLQPPSEQVVLRDKALQKQQVPEPSVAPSAAQQFAKDYSNEETSNGKAAETQTRSVDEDQNEKDPLWDNLGSEVGAPTTVEPAPPAEIDWPNDEQQPTVIPTPADPRTVLAAWRMASKWSLAAGAYGKGWQADRYGEIWQQADFAAQLLKVQLPPLPEDVTADKLLSTATTLLFETAGPQLAEAVGIEHSAAHRALCDLAIQTHALLLIYKPTGNELPSLVASIRQAAEDSPLPERLWRPVVESLDSGADFDDVKRAVFKLHNQATKYLSDLVSP